MKYLMAAVSLVAGLATSSLGNTAEPIAHSEALGKLSSAAGAPASETQLLSILKPLVINYPKRCEEDFLGRSGLCLLSARIPLAQNSFMVSPLDSYGVIIGSPIPVKYNKFLSLSPGRYALYSSSGIDEGHELRFEISQGQETTIKTATVKFGQTNSTRRLQHYQSVNGTNGKGCHPDQFKSGVRALLPGNYQLEVLERKNTESTLACATGGTTFNALAGQTLSATVAKMRPQTVPQSNRYKHPDGVSALGTISSFRDNILSISVLPNWRLINGIYNPLSRPYSALILYGLGTKNYVIPFTVRRNQRECGISLPEGGLTPHVLLTGCKFKGNKLIDFKIQPGSFYTVNNRHGKTAIEGNFINSPIVVNNVSFSLN